MKIAILTFHFAYNYGAMLQAYALKDYLKERGHEADIVPFYPAHLKQGYSISPFEHGITMKHRLYNLITYTKRAGQAEKFDAFKKRLSNTPEFVDAEKIIDFLKPYELLICGSDQIWNDKITGKTGSYFGEKTSIKKISYAASLGSSALDDIQKKYAVKYLPSFLAVSVREEKTKELLVNIRPDIAVVCDPVFLRNMQDWIKIEEPVKTKERYLLLYLLEDNKELVRHAKRYASKNHLHIYEIYPTLGMRHKGTESLKKVGPGEFIYLMRNAEAICTNSFHAVCFSIIFRKMLLHIPNSISPERTQNLLNKAGIELHHDNPCYDTSCAIEKLEDYISGSKDFISKSLKTAGRDGGA